MIAHAPQRWPAPTVAPLVLQATAGQPAVHGCTRGISDRWAPTVMVTVNGHRLSSPQFAGFTVWFAGRDTLVRLTAIPHGGPTCAKAITWLPHATVTVRVKLSY